MGKQCISTIFTLSNSTQTPATSPSQFSGLLLVWWCWVIHRSVRGLPGTTPRRKPTLAPMAAVNHFSARVGPWALLAMLDCWSVWSRARLVQTTTAAEWVHGYNHAGTLRRHSFAPVSPKMCRSFRPMLFLLPVLYSWLQALSRECQGSLPSVRCSTLPLSSHVSVAHCRDNAMSSHVTVALCRENAKHTALWSSCPSASLYLNILSELSHTLWFLEILTKYSHLATSLHLPGRLARSALFHTPITVLK